MFGDSIPILLEMVIQSNSFIDFQHYLFIFDTIDITKDYKDKNFMTIY